MTKEQFLESLRLATVQGGEQAAKKFMADNFAKLPEDIQADLLIELLIDAGKKNEMRNLAIDVGEAALDTVEEIEKAEKELQQLEKENSQSQN